MHIYTGKGKCVFEANRMNTHCMVCQRIEKIKQGENPYFVKELETGYVVIGDFQRFKGYTLFICKECQPEIHLLEPEFRKKFLEEMSIVGEAVFHAFHPDKLNYELLGVGNAVHMHWHFFPRREGDTPAKGPVWKLDKTEMYDEKYRPSPEELEKMKGALLLELNKLLE